MGLFKDRCKDSKGNDWIPKDLYKDSSWNSIGLGLEGYETFLDGCYEDCYKDSLMISMRILSGFQTILLDFYKGFYTDPKGFYRISVIILVVSLSGFCRIFTGHGVL